MDTPDAILYDEPSPLDANVAPADIVTDRRRRCYSVAVGGPPKRTVSRLPRNLSASEACGNRSGLTSRVVSTSAVT